MSVFDNFPAWAKKPPNEHPTAAPTVADTSSPLFAAPPGVQQAAQAPDQSDSTADTAQIECSPQPSPQKRRGRPPKQR